MTDDRLMWLKASSEAFSHRRMYAISMDIASSNAASSDLRTTAMKIVRALQDIIELPIADAKILTKGSKKFAKLVKALEAADEISVMAA